MQHETLFCVTCYMCSGLPSTRWSSVYQSLSSSRWLLSVLKTVSSIVSRLCGFCHHPQAKDSASKPKSSTSASSSITSSLSPTIGLWVCKLYSKKVYCSSKVLIRAMSLLLLHACATPKNFFLALHYSTTDCCTISSSMYKWLYLNTLSRSLFSLSLTVLVLACIQG